MEKVYAEVIDRAVSSGKDEKKLVDGLVAHLTREGRMKLLPGILRELHARHARKEKLRPVLEIASEGEKTAAVQEAKEAGLEAKEVTVNGSLISGWRARSAGRLLDRSGKSALVEIYRNIVTK